MSARLDTVPPAGSADLEPRGLPPQAARDVLSALSRAVQRATIYPAGHPSVGVATTTPFVHAVARLLEQAPRLLLAFTSEAILLGTQPADARPFEAPWLGARLTARGVASLEFTAALSPEGARQLVAWLAQGDELTPEADLPPIAGCEIRRIDYSRAQFRDTPDDDGQAGAVALAWQQICRSVGGDGATSDPRAIESPRALAEHVLHVLERHEGTGIGELSERLVGLNACLRGLTGDVLTTVKQRLGQFVEALTPELRGRLLRATPTDSDEKLALLTQLVDQLPRTLTVDMVRRLKFERGGSAHRFVALMLKLTSVAACDPAVAMELDERCDQEGLPLDARSLGDARAQSVLRQLLTPRADDVRDINPEEYRERLEALSAEQASRRYKQFRSDHLHDPRDARIVAWQAGVIALRLLETGQGDGADTATCLERVRVELPGWLEAQQWDLLASAASIFEVLASDGAVTVAAMQAKACLDFFASPATVREVVARVDAADHVGEQLTVLARAGGAGVAEAVLARLVRRPAPEVVSRLTTLVGALDIRVVRSALAGLCGRMPSTGRALITVLHGTSALVPLAEVLTGDPDPGVRAEACRLTLEAAHGADAERVLRRSLADEDARVVDAGVEAVERADAVLAPALLCAFLDARRPPPIAAVQHRLVRVLAGRPEATARLVLAEALNRRRSRFDQSARRLSRALAEALERTGGSDAAAAATAWRRSPAGVVSWLLGDASGEVA